MIQYNITAAYVFMTICLHHFIGDFIFQPRDIANRKSKELKILIRHGALYSLPLLLINIKWAAVNAIFHIVVDYVTSQITTHAYKNKKQMLFFSTIGFDQLIHIWILFYTYAVMVGQNKPWSWAVLEVI